MRRGIRRTTVVAAGLMSISFVLLAILAPSQRPVIAQGKQGANQDCEKIKQDLEVLNDVLGELNAEIKSLNEEITNHVRYSPRQDQSQSHG